MMNVINSIILATSKELLKWLDKGRKDPVSSQLETFRYLIENGKESCFGKEHRFSSIRTFEDFQKNVPVRDYNQFKPYIDRLRQGEDYVLWNQKTSMFARSSGTSSDKSKFIPVTHDNLMSCHYRGFRKMLSTYLLNNPKSRLFNGKSLTLGGSVQLDAFSNTGAINGDLSALLLKNSPYIAELVRQPRRDIALLPDFEKKIDLISRECAHADITNFSGVPSWNLIMLQRLLEVNKARYVTDLWPNLELFMHGGISFEPYKAQYHKIIPKPDMHYLENYNASEGYFAFQDDPRDKGMLLTLSNGVFYEFIPLSRLDDVLSGRSQEVYTVEGVSRNVQYAMVISTNSGLWRYLIGDCVEFTSLFPHKIRVTGRTQLYINAFGEELMIHNADESITEACRECNLVINEYTVAPIFMEEGKKGAHQWVVEFGREVTLSEAEKEHFAEILDKALCRHNSDYEAKRSGNATMSRLQLTTVPYGTFDRWMAAQGKRGGQNKIPRLHNNREYIDRILSTL